MDDTVNPRSYATVPRFDVRAGIALGRATLTAAPSEPTAIVERELGRLRTALGALEAAWQPVSTTVAPTPDRRGADQVLDGAWAGLHGRLAAWNRLSDAAHPEVSRAAALQATVFPGGLSFLTLAYERQWAESQRRLDQIDAGALAAELDALCGSAFLAAVRTAHAQYGVVLGITEATPDPSEVPASLRDPFAAFRTALTRYVQKLVGTLDDEDPAAVRAVKAAVRPLDDYRATLASRAARSKSKPASEPDPSPTSEPTN